MSGPGEGKKARKVRVLDRAATRLSSSDRSTRVLPPRTQVFPRRLLTPAEVAGYLAVDRSYVYEHADELGARRLGTGPKARLRFALEDVDRAIAGQARGTSPSAGLES